MSAIDDFLSYDAQRKTKLAERSKDELRAREVALRSDPHVQAATTRGAVAGGAIEGAVMGGVSGGIPGAVVGTGMGGVRGLISGSVMNSPTAQKHPLLVGAAIPALVSPGGTIGGAINRGREQANIDPDLLTPEGHALLRTRHYENQRAKLREKKKVARGADELEAREVALRSDPRVRDATVRGAAIGGGLEGAAIGGALGGLPGAAAGGAVGIPLGALAGHSLNYRVSAPIPTLISPGGALGGHIGRTREQIDIDPDVAGPIAHRLLNTRHYKARQAKLREKKKAASFDAGLMAAAPLAGNQVAAQGFRQAFGTTVKGMGALAGAGLIVGAGMKGLEKAYEYAANSISRARGYKAMLEASPELKKMDRTMVERSYRTLHKFNPEMASDPMVSSSFVRSTAEMRQVPFATAGALAQSRDRAKGRGVFEYGLSTAMPGIALADRATTPQEPSELVQRMVVEKHKADLQASSLAEQKAYHETKGRARAAKEIEEKEMRRQRNLWEGKK